MRVEIIQRVVRGRVRRPRAVLPRAAVAAAGAVGGREAREDFLEVEAGLGEGLFFGEWLVHEWIK